MAPSVHVHVNIVTIVPPFADFNSSLLKSATVCFESESFLLGCLVFMFPPFGLIEFIYEI